LCSPACNELYSAQVSLPEWQDRVELGQAFIDQVLIEHAESREVAFECTSGRVLCPEIKEIFPEIVRVAHRGSGYSPGSHLGWTGMFGWYAWSNTGFAIKAETFEIGHKPQTV